MQRYMTSENDAPWVFFAHILGPAVLGATTQTPCVCIPGGLHHPLSQHGELLLRVADAAIAFWFAHFFASRVPTGVPATLLRAAAPTFKLSGQGLHQVQIKRVAPLRERPRLSYRDLARAPLF